MSPIIARNEGGSFTPAPEGQHRAVCCDVVDLGMVTSQWEGQTRTAHKVRLVFQIDEPMDDGRPFMVSQQFTLSLHEKAALRKFLEGWRGVAFTAQELAGFDVETLLGANALLQIIHAHKPDGKTFANINAVMRLPKGMPKLAARDYVRVQDREPAPAAPAAQPTTRTATPPAATVSPAQGSVNGRAVPRDEAAIQRHATPAAPAYDDDSSLPF
jgi:hypothetical protein